MSCNKKNFICNKKHCDICFDKSFASIEYSKNIVDKNIDTAHILKRCHDKYDFLCEICFHIYNISFNDITRGRRCSYCHSRKLCDDENCKSCFDKSFASNEKSKFWNYQKNNNVSPREVFRNSKNKYIFDCENCKHDFESDLNSINNNQWCSYCGNKKLCSNNDCELCFNKSFASHPLVYKFSDKNIIKPKEIFLRSNDKYIFNCEICNHEFNSRIADFKTDKLNCPYCAKKVLCENNGCLFCFNNSFASHEKSVFFSNKNNIETNKIFKKTHTKYIFNCNECNNEFISSPEIISSGCWCPICKHKTEKILYKWLCEKYKKENVKSQFVIEKNENKLRYDFLIKDLNILIELDGNQHFIQIMNWTSPEYNLNNDINKINYALEKNYTIIHLLQMDVLKNINDWDKKLLNCIQKNETPQIIIIDNDNIYKNHISNINNVKNLQIVD
jgi:very-short-patch-repair endonuclease